MIQQNKLKQLFNGQAIMIPGAYNGLTARLCAEQGFQALYVSGAAVSAAAGQPDIGVVTIDQFTNVIKQVKIASGLPVIADADTGFGEGEMCAKTVWEYYMAGASALHIEDQVFPKRCGHLDGKQLISREDMINKIKIAKRASIECSNGEFIICARTDARGVIGIEETIIRSKMYIEAGADMIFPEGLQSLEEFKQVSQALKSEFPNVYLLANMTEYGVTPYINQKQFQELKYDCIIYPVSTLRVASKAITDFLIELKQEGVQEKSLDKMQTRKELYKSLNYQPGNEWIYPSSTSK